MKIESFLIESHDQYLCNRVMGNINIVAKRKISVYESRNENQSSNISLRAFMSYWKFGFKLNLMNNISIWVFCL